tara:strand:- start:205 stop:963 length:759 start_codon:yes stop_codon:yes gene_type:complete
MNRLDSSQASLWTNINLLSNCHLSLEFPTCSFESKICLSSAQFSGGNLIIPDEGLALARGHFNEIYALQNPNRLYFLSHLRNFGLTLTPEEEKAKKQLEFFIKSFELERGPSSRDEKIESVDEPNLCPCCANDANIRIQQMAHNPLTAILIDATQRSLSLIVSCDSPGGRFTTQLLPADIYRDQEFLVAKGNNRIFSVNIRHLHTMRLFSQMIDGESHESLALLNSHGIITGVLSLPTSLASHEWQKLLGRS